MTDPDVLAVLRAYPQIYLACHVEHRTRGRASGGLTSRDSAILAHVAEPGGVSPARLARHLGIAPSTLSAALARLAGQKMVTLDADPADARRRLVKLTEAGLEMMAAASVLDPTRLAAVLARLSEEERRRAVEGLRLIASAALALRDEEG